MKGVSSADWYYRVSRWYMIGIAGSIGFLFFLGMLVTPGDRGYFQNLQNRWAFLSTQHLPCRQFGYVDQSHLLSARPKLTKRERESYQDRVGLVQYTIAPYVVLESTTSKCLLVDVVRASDQQVAQYAKRNGYVIFDRYTLGRYVLIKQ